MSELIEHVHSSILKQEAKGSVSILVEVAKEVRLYWSERSNAVANEIRCLSVRQLKSQGHILAVDKQPFVVVG